MLIFATLIGLAGAILATSFVPTAAEMQASFDQGQKFYASGAYDQAIDRYTHVMESRHSLLQMARVRVAVGDVEAPLQEVAPYQIGNAYFKMGEEQLALAARSRDEAERAEKRASGQDLLQQAIGSFLQAEEQSTVPALKALARSRVVTAFYQLEDYQQTILEAEQLVERYPASPHVAQVLYDIGWSHFERGEYARSIAAFGDLVQRFPTGYRASRSLFQIGECHMRLAQYDDAIAAFQRLVDAQRLGDMTEQEALKMTRDKIAGLVNETDLEVAAKALLRIGECHERLGNHDSAVSAYGLVAEQFRNERRLAEEAWLRQADLHQQRGDFDAGIAVYRRALETQQQDFGRARLQLLLANRYFQSERFAESLREYETYRRLYAEQAAQAGLPLEATALQMARAWFGLAAAAPATSDPYHRAAAELRQALADFPDSRFVVELRFNLALALERQNHDKALEEALELYRAVAEDPQAGGYRHSAMFQSARAYQRMQQLDTARGLYVTLAEELADRDEADVARFELGIVERDAGRSDAALQQLLAVRAGSSLFARSRLEAGRLLLQEGDPAQAAVLLTAGAAADSSSRRLFDFLLASAKSQQGDLAGAIAHYSRVLDARVPDSRTAATADDIGDTGLLERARYSRGVAQYRLQQYPAAIQDLAYTWQDTTLARRAPRLLAAAYSAAGQPDAALAVYRQLMAVSISDAERAEFLLALTEIDYRRGRFADAVDSGSRLIALSLDATDLPEGRDYHLREKGFWLVADSQLRLGQFQASARTAAEGRQAFPSGLYAADLVLVEGQAALRAGDHERAAQSFFTAVDRHADQVDLAETWYYLGYAHFQATHFTKAIAAFEQARRLGATGDLAVDAALRIGECHYNLKDFDTASAAYGLLVEQYPDSPLAEEALYNIGWCVMSRSSEVDAEAARAAFTSYVEAWPEGRYVAMARYTLGELAYNEGQYPVAYDMFRAIEQDFPGSPAAAQAADVLPDLREAVAYQHYTELMARFQAAAAAEDEQAILALIPAFEELEKEYGDTSSGIAARVNIGVSYQKLGQWRQAVESFAAVLQAGDNGDPAVTPQIRAFVERRRNSIEAKHL